NLICFLCGLCVSLRPSALKGPLTHRTQRYAEGRREKTSIPTRFCAKPLRSNEPRMIETDFSDKPTRRLFLQNSLMSLLAVPLLRHRTWTTEGDLTITLEGRGEKLGKEETVSFGLPLPFGFLHDARKVRVVDERGVD